MLSRRSFVASLGAALAAVPVLGRLAPSRTPARHTGHIRVPPCEPVAPLPWGSGQCHIIVDEMVTEIQRETPTGKRRYCIRTADLPAEFASGRLPKFVHRMLVTSDRVKMRMPAEVVIGELWLCG